MELLATIVGGRMFFSGGSYSFTDGDTLARGMLTLVKCRLKADTV
jgi:hypothetical protein